MSLPNGQSSNSLQVAHCGDSIEPFQSVVDKFLHFIRVNTSPDFQGGSQTEILT
jgi:hypothetical protein